jgi:cyclic pyranopterin phosphate synthase
MATERVLVDSYGRRIASLRISLTDRCNFRCVYCTPPEGFSVTPKPEYLTRDEVVRIVRIMGRYGVGRVRLTGGEPLLRDDIVEIVAAVRAVETVEEVSITTNASRLAALAVPLKGAGLDRLNISLDSLDESRFARVARTAQYARVMEGIDAAIDAGFPVKVNVVVLKGMTDEEIVDFVAMAVRRDIEVRFLEFMPLCGDGWQADLVYPIGGVRDVVARRFDLLEKERGDRTAQTFAIAGGGRVGFIGSLSEPFCNACSRVRISADGRIRPCLFSGYEVPLRELMRDGASDDAIVGAIRTAVANKSRGNQFVEAPFREESAQSQVVSGGEPLIRRVGG